MAVVAVALVPHPPILLEAVGGAESRRVQATQQALGELGRRLSAMALEALVMITPHGPVFRDAVAIWGLDRLDGDLSSFGAKGVSFQVPGDLELARATGQEARRLGVRTIWLDRPTARRHGVQVGLDHGLMVPLYFLVAQGIMTPLAAVSSAFLPVEDLYRFGQAIRRAAEVLGRRVAVVASGDLSHRLTPDAPAGFSPRGAEFDRLIQAALTRGDPWAVLQVDPESAEAAGECGWRSLIMALGALEGQRFKADLLSYEGPFGVGYAVAHLEPLPEAREELLPRIKQFREDRRRAESPPVALARRSLESYIRQGQVIDPPDPLPGVLQQPAGAFVSLKVSGQLRGCIGTIGATRPNLALEIIHNAIAAATDDPRFPPVEPEELDTLSYSVDVLGQPEPVSGPDELDPQRYGVIVSHAGRSGLLLPALAGIEEVEAQVRIAMRKADIPAGTPGVKLQRFTVIRYY